MDKEYIHEAPISFPDGAKSVHLLISFHCDHIRHLVNPGLSRMGRLYFPPSWNNEEQFNRDITIAICNENEVMIVREKED